MEPTHSAHINTSTARVKDMCTEREAEREIGCKLRRSYAKWALIFMELQPTECFIAEHTQCQTIKLRHPNTFSK